MKTTRKVEMPKVGQVVHMITIKAKGITIDRPFTVDRSGYPSTHEFTGGGSRHNITNHYPNKPRDYSPTSLMFWDSGFFVTANAEDVRAAVAMLRRVMRKSLKAKSAAAEKLAAEIADAAFYLSMAKPQKVGH